tara:strand:+ start:140 stop:637 length:498 start_codon:yes stop_codon:yes gene_type:complete
LTEVVAEGPPKKGGAKGLIVLLAVIVLGGGGGFAAGMMGLIPIPFVGQSDADNLDPQQDTKNINQTPPTFHSLPEFTIPLGGGATAQFLRTKLHLEIDPKSAESVRQAEPRIVDTLNIFLRAVDERDVSSILAMERLRAEMLRRVRLVTGDEAVKAVLIAEFLLR